MKDVGMARKIDDLGRIVLPAELRRLFGIHAGDELEIAVDGDSILLRKIQAGCILCDGVIDLRPLHGKQVCADCRRALTAPSAASGSAGDGPDSALGSTPGGSTESLPATDSPVGSDMSDGTAATSAPAPVPPTADLGPGSGRA